MSSLGIILNYDKLINLTTYTDLDELGNCFLYMGPNVILCVNVF